MTTSGVVINGMIKPDRPLGLADGQHVQFEILESSAVSSKRSAKRFLELAMEIKSQVKVPVRFTREELHERH